MAVFSDWVLKFASGLRSRYGSAGFAIAGLGCLLIGSGCSSITLSNAWRDPTYAEAPVKSTLILAMKRDPVRRRIWEDALASELTRHGVKAIPAYQQFPEGVPDTTAIAAAVDDNDIESVIVIKELANEEKTRYVEGYVTIVPVTRYNPWTRYYQTWYHEVHRPGYTETEKTVRHEITMWITRGSARMVWSAIGDVINPNSSDEVRNEVVTAVVPELERQLLIPSK